MSGEVQILQDAPTEPSPHTSLLYIPPLWRASRKTSEFRIKTILLENTFHRNWHAQGFAPDQYGPSVLHKRPFCNAFSGCGSGKRFFHSESTRCRKKREIKMSVGALSNFSNNFKSELVVAALLILTSTELFWDTLYQGCIREAIVSKKGSFFEHCSKGLCPPPPLLFEHLSYFAGGVWTSCGDFFRWCPLIQWPEWAPHI